MLKDEELIQKSIQGDVNAFGELAQRYQNKVYTLAYRFMGNEEDAYDVAQEAMVKVHRSLPQFKGDMAFSFWLYRITSGVCLEELRRRKRRPVSVTIGNREREGGLSYRIQLVLNEMKPEHRAAVILKDIMQFSYEEVASTLECSMGTLKTRLNRGRMLLREKLNTSTF